MNILILGSGGREHTFAWKIAQSTRCKKIYVAPGNAGTSQIAINIDINPLNFNEVANFISQEAINMLIVGPEAPLVKGIRDFFENHDDFQELMIVGPGKLGATLEGSKDFTKKFLQRHDIPTASYATFTEDNYQEGVKYLENHSLPIVLKADGLAAGKGVLICETLDEAKKYFKEMILDAKFGNASNKVVVEEYLKGIELSVFILTDGESYVTLPEAKDYKRVGEGDTGLNTGGMGAISPVPFANDDFMQKVENKIIQPTINGLIKDKIPYQGFIFIGLMKVKNEPYVIEYNVRMGDPETEVVIPRIKNDFLEVLEASCSGNLSKIKIQTNSKLASTIIMVAGGYPQEYQKGNTITGLDNKTNSIIFHSGTAIINDQIVTNGGRVLAITSLSNSLDEALNQSYLTANNINWENNYYRKDIGLDVLE